MKAIGVAAFLLLAPLQFLPLFAIFQLDDEAVSGIGIVLLYLLTVFCLDCGVASRLLPLSDITAGCMLGIGVLGVLVSFYAMFSIVGLILIWPSLAALALGCTSIGQILSGNRSAV